MLRRINRVLPELIVGIMIYGVLIQMAGVWFVTDKLRYSTGLWIGIFMAVGMIIHMAVAIEDSINLVLEHKARGKMIVQSLLRYVVVVLIFFLVVYFKLGNLLTLFIGVMGLKAGAYLQPLTHKAIEKLTGQRKESFDNEK